MVQRGVEREESREKPGRDDRPSPQNVGN